MIGGGASRGGAEGGTGRRRDGKGFTPAVVLDRGVAGYLDANATHRRSAGAAPIAGRTS